MTPTELAQVRSILEARRFELEDMSRNREAIAADSSGDVLDQIQHGSECDMAIGARERASARLLEVRAALRRIHLGTFGSCIDCQEQISTKRLAAAPWAASCLACREAADGSRTLTGSAMVAQTATDRRLLAL